jgi:hypothetical protein
VARVGEDVAKSRPAGSQTVPLRSTYTPRGEEAVGAGASRRISPVDRGRGARPFYAKDPKARPGGGKTGSDPKVEGESGSDPIFQEEGPSGGEEAVGKATSAKETGEEEAARERLSYRPERDALRTSGGGRLGFSRAEIDSRSRGARQHCASDHQLPSSGPGVT